MPTVPGPAFQHLLLFSVLFFARAMIPGAILRDRQTPHIGKVFSPIPLEQKVCRFGRKLTHNILLARWFPCPKTWLLRGLCEPNNPRALRFLCRKIMFAILIFFVK